MARWALLLSAWMQHPVPYILEEYRVPASETHKYDITKPRISEVSDTSQASGLSFSWLLPPERVQGEP